MAIEKVKQKVVKPDGSIVAINVVSATTKAEAKDLIETKKKSDKKSSEKDQKDK